MRPPKYSKSAVVPSESPYLYGVAESPSRAPHVSFSVFLRFGYLSGALHLQREKYETLRLSEEIR